MIKCEQLTYIQMQKTGCSHIALLLESLLGGRRSKRKHDAPSTKEIDEGGYFVSSIRNPWDWYLSLWTFGVQGGGSLHRFTVEGRFWSELYKAHCLADAGLFRAWLKELLNPDNSSLLGEGYGVGTIAKLCGFMTYRYLKLCCRDPFRVHQLEILDVDLAKFEKDNCYIDFFIRQESLEEDLCIAIEKVQTLTGEEEARIYSAGRTNASERPLPLADYYDEETIELVGNRDRLLVDKFGYSPPKGVDDVPSDS